MEVDDELSAAGVLELAWTTGLIKWEDDPKPGWYDTETGELVEVELVERYHDTVVERCGIREFVDDGAIDPDHASPLLVSVFLDKDFPSWCPARPTPGRSSSSIPNTRSPCRCPTPPTGR